MADFLRRLDRAWARGEGWLTVAVLILMVLVAGFQAAVRNLTRFDLQWANQLLTDMDWADSLMRKGTLWLAFLGASLAAHHHKHINIDPLLRIAPAKAKYTMLAIGVFIAGLICIALTYSFSTAVYLNLTERPVEYEMLAPDGGSMHLCDATDAQLAELVDAEKPAIFCVFRSLLDVIGIPAETPGAAFQLIVPLMFAIMALRFLAQGIGYGLIIAGGAEAVALADAEEKRHELAQQADSMGPPPSEADSDKGQPK